jgi:TPR repeat protein
MKLELLLYTSIVALMVGMPGSLLGMESDEKASSLQRTAAVASSKQSSTDQQNQLEEAEAWYRKTANLGHVEAMNNLAMLLENANPPQPLGYARLRRR